MGKDTHEKHLPRNVMTGQCLIYVNWLPMKCSKMHNVYAVVKVTMDDDFN